jgi:hypothetical protein
VVADLPEPEALHRSAMEVVLAWGPERTVAELDRLLARHPGIDPAAAGSALTEAHRVMAEAESLAPELKGVGAAPTTKQAIRRDHLWLTAELLDRAVQQGLYFHWRDTGI